MSIDASCTFPWNSHQHCTWNNLPGFEESHYWTAKSNSMKRQKCWPADTSQQICFSWGWRRSLNEAELHEPSSNNRILTGLDGLKPEQISIYLMSEGNIKLSNSFRDIGQFVRRCVPFWCFGWFHSETQGIWGRSRSATGSPCRSLGPPPSPIPPASHTSLGAWWWPLIYCQLPLLLLLLLLIGTHQPNERKQSQGVSRFTIYTSNTVRHCLDKTLYKYEWMLWTGNKTLQPVSNSLTPNNGYSVRKKSSRVTWGEKTSQRNFRWLISTRCINYKMFEICFCFLQSAWAASPRLDRPCRIC